MRAIALITLLVLAAPAAAKPKGPPCGAGRYLLAAPLVANAAAPATDAIEAGAARVAIGGACAGLAPKRFRAVAGGTRVKAVWPSCEGLAGRVKLTGTIIEDCTLLRGQVKARRFRARVQARRSTCGDGTVDAVAREDCDPPGGTCDARCRRLAPATLGVAGGRVTSDDGLLTLEIPPGAVPADTTFTIRALTPAEAATRGGEAGWELGPDGIQFATPITATVTLSESPVAADGSLGSALFALFTTNAAGDPEIPPEQRLVLDGITNVATLSVELAHFTPLTFRPVDPRERRAAYTRVAFAPGTRLGVSQPFTPTVEFQLTEEKLNDQGVIYIDQTAAGDIIVYTGAPEVELGRVGGGRTRVAAPVSGYACGPREGIGEYRARIEVRSAGAIFGIGAQTSLVTQLTTLIECQKPKRKTTTTSTSTTSTSTSSRTVPTAATTSLTSTTVAAPTTSSSTQIPATTSTTRSTTTTTTSLPPSNCCDCPQPRGCASGPAVRPADCTDFGCTFVAGAMCTPSGDCAAPTTSSTSTSTSSTTSTSTQSVRNVPVNAPEGLWVVDAGFYGAFGERFAVVVAGANGWAVIDVDTGAVLVGAYLTAVGPALFAATPLGAHRLDAFAAPAGMDAPDLQGVIQAGPNGPAITLWDPAAGRFGFTQVFPNSPPCFDAVPLASEPSSGVIFVACGVWVQTFRPNEDFQFFTVGPTYTGFPQAAGPVLSAIRRTPGGPIVAVTQGTPGRILRHPATGAAGEAAEDVGPAGNSPRRIRCAAGVCAVSNFASDSLTVLTWSAQNAIAIAGTVAVGNGPVGIDVRARTDGNVEVVSTGLEDDSWSVTVLRPNGTTASNQKRAAPAGCTRPGHVVWGPGRRAVMTCNGSNAIAVVQAP